MIMRGPKPKGNVEIEWSHDFTYAIGLIVTDGNLSPNGRHISFTSKDFEQVKNLKKILGLDNKIGRKGSGSNKQKIYYIIQFGDVLFYEFLKKIGITPAKSKTLGAVKVPDEYFFDFLRGCFDGDGTSYSYFDPRWKSSFLFYIAFASASKKHADWLRKELKKRLGVFGHLVRPKTSSCYQLRYGKNEAQKIVEEMYKNPKNVCLKRKRLKIERSLAMMSKPQKKG